MKKHSPLHLQQGLSLLESLVAIVVMALGILGILGAQMRTLTDTQAGVRRAQAIRLIEDLSERLQNNPNALGSLSTYTTTPSSSDDCASTACTPEKLAAYDIRQWRTNVSDTIRGSQAIVFLPQGGSRQLGVMVGWNESLYNHSGQNFTATERTDLVDPLTVSGTNSTGATVECPTNLTCHLQYIQPTQRCTPSNQNNNTLYCLN